MYFNEAYVKWNRIAITIWILAVLSTWFIDVRALNGTLMIAYANSFYHDLILL